MNHQMQKNRARAEALSHYGSNVMEMRGGMSHDDHKLKNYIDHLDDYQGKGMNRQTAREEMGENGYKVKIGESC